MSVLDAFANGNVIQFIHARTGILFEQAFIVEPMAIAGRYTFALVQEPNLHLRVNDKGIVQLNGARGQWAQFELQTVQGQPNLIMLRSIGNNGKRNLLGGVHWFLGVDQYGQWIGNAGPDALTVRVVTTGMRTRQGVSGAPALPWDDTISARITYDHLAALYKYGYLQLKQVVPRKLIDAALHVINHQLGKTDAWEVDEAHGGKILTM